jgi:hypothetical protein
MAILLVVYLDVSFFLCNFAAKTAKFFDLKVQSVAQILRLCKLRNKFLCFALDLS